MRALTVIERKATMRKHQRSAGDCCSMWYSRRNSRRVGDVNTVIASRSRRRRRCHPLRARRPINSTRLAAHVFTTRYSVVYIPAHQSTERPRPDPFKTHHHRLHTLPFLPALIHSRRPLSPPPASQRCWHHYNFLYTSLSHFRLRDLVLPMPLPCYGS